MRKACFCKLLLCICLCLPCGILNAAEAQAETDYLAILLQDQKVGHAIHTRTLEGDVVITTEQFSMTLGRGGQAVKVTSKETHRETKEGKPLSFEMSMITSGIEQTTIGTIKDGKLSITRQAMGQAQTLELDWPQGALLGEGVRLFQLQRGLNAGDTFEVSMFRPDLLMGVTAQVKIGDKANIDLFGRVLELTEVQMTMSVQGQAIAMTSYVDQDMKAMKTLVPMMGMTMEMVACDKNFAMRDDDIVDFLEHLSIASPVKIDTITKIDSITYTLKPKDTQNLTFPSTSNQTVRKENNSFIITIKKAEPVENVTFPYSGNNPDILDALKPTEYLQCNQQAVIDLAKHAVGGTKDAAKAVRQIESFVNGFITQKDLSVGYASAAEVADSRQGDCSEHAVLTAAMCRAIGIPARIACGVVYVDSFIGKNSLFGGHMWVEAYIGDQWIGLDATLADRGGFGPGHITLATGNGDPADFFSLVNTLGCFTIEKIDIQKKPEK